jgi:hypothetical protein
MSSRPQSQRPPTPNIIKRELEEESDNITIADTKRQRKEIESSRTSPTMSPATATPSVPQAVLQVYQQMLPKNHEGIEFLFDERFSQALQVPAERVATAYNISKEDAIEELRRLLVIKAFTVDKDANKISPTPLSP